MPFLIAVINLSLLFFYVFFVSSFWCIYAIFNADKSSFFFSWLISSFCVISDVKDLYIVISFLVLRSICWSSSLQEWFRVSYMEDLPGVYPFDEIPAIKFGFEKFSRSHYFFFYLLLFDSVHFQIIIIIVVCLFVVPPWASPFFAIFSNQT